MNVGSVLMVVPSLCEKELGELSTIVDEQTERTEKNIQKYKALLDYKDSTMNAELFAEDADRIRKGLVFERQYLVYLDALRVSTALIIGPNTRGIKAYA